MRFSTKCVWFKSLDRWDKSGWEKLLCITLWSDLLHEGASGGLAPQFYFWAPQFQLHTKKQNKTNTTKCFFLSEINLLFQDHGQRCLLCWGWSVHSGQCYGLL